MEMRKFNHIQSRFGNLLRRGIYHKAFKKLSSEKRITVLTKYYKARGYSAVNDPYRIYAVSPEEIDYVIHASSLNNPTPVFGVIGGDWDMNKSKIEDFKIYNMFKAHFTEGTPWENTRRYKEVQEEYQSTRRIGVLDIPQSKHSIKAYNEYLAYFETLYEDIRENGYLSQEKLNPSNDFANRKTHAALNEIQLMIGRDGSMILNHGAHRFCIAKILGLDKIPVRTQVRHSCWQKVRDLAVSDSTCQFRNQLPSSILEHPDIY